MPDGCYGCFNCNSERCTSVCSRASGKVETESDGWDSISGEINFRDTDNNESIFVQFNNEKVEDYRWGDDRKIHMKYCRQKL